MTKEECLPILLAEIKASFPGIPEPAEVIPHKWKYSQTRKSMDSNPGRLEKFPYFFFSKKNDFCSGFQFVNEKVALFGDGFVKQANFDGCIESAHMLSQHLINKI